MLSSLLHSHSFFKKERVKLFLVCAENKIRPALSMYFTLYALTCLN